MHVSETTINGVLHTFYANFSINFGFGPEKFRVGMQDAATLFTHIALNELFTHLDIYEYRIETHMLHLLPRWNDIDCRCWAGSFFLLHQNGFCSNCVHHNYPIPAVGCSNLVHTFLFAAANDSLAMKLKRFSLSSKKWLICLSFIAGNFRREN